MPDQSVEVRLPVQLMLWNIPNFVRYVDPTRFEDTDRPLIGGESSISIKNMDPQTLSYYLDRHRQAVFDKAGLKDPSPPRHAR